MHKIVALWAIPRSTSTAFEWMMRMRGDMECFHEPFGEAWYQGEEPLWLRLTADSVRTPGLTLKRMGNAAGGGTLGAGLFQRLPPLYRPNVG